MNDSTNTTKLRVVASYTTIPSRYEVLKTSILTLKSQTVPLDAIYVSIPKLSRRLNKPYPPIPPDLASLCTIVYVDVDYGPITKILGALLSESDRETIIITCDDDVHFKKTHVEILLKHHKNHPDVAICGTGALLSRGILFLCIVSTVEPFQNLRGFSGFDVDKNGRNVDLIFGVAGCLYLRGFFPTNELLHDTIFKYSLADDAIFHNDDILLSGYLSKCGIKRKIFPDIPTITHGNAEDGLSSDFFKMITRMNVAISKVKALGFYTSMEDYYVDESVTVRTIFVFIIILILLILSFFLYRILFFSNIFT